MSQLYPQILGATSRALEILLRTAVVPSASSSSKGFEGVKENLPEGCRDVFISTGGVRYLSILCGLSTSSSCYFVYGINIQYYERRKTRSGHQFFSCHLNDIDRRRSNLLGDNVALPLHSRGVYLAYPPGSSCPLTTIIQLCDRTNQNHVWATELVLWAVTDRMHGLNKSFWVAFEHGSKGTSIYVLRSKGLSRELTKFWVVCHAHVHPTQDSGVKIILSLVLPSRRATLTVYTSVHEKI